MTVPSPVLQIKDVSAGYGASDIIRVVNVNVLDRLVTTIAGPNGAGKSTLVRTVAGLLRPRAGAIVMDGRDITALSSPERARAGLGYVPQEHNVFKNLTIGENLKIGLEFINRHATAKDHASARDEVLALFPDLSGRLNDIAGTLSGGQRQMLAIGCALVAKPRVLLLDEPSAGLSPRYISEMMQAVRAVNETGIAVLMVEQNLVEAVRISHEVVLLAGGRVRGTWAGADFLDNPTVHDLFFGGERRSRPSSNARSIPHDASAA